jgi:hypothetical protein
MLLEFFNEIILPAALWPLDRLSLLTEISISWEVKLSCADCLEIWEPQTPCTFGVCTGVALHFYLTFKEAETLTIVYHSEDRRPLSVGILMLLKLCHPITKHCLHNTSRCIYHCETFSFG